MKTLATLFTALVLALAGYALACPFCTVESQTLAEEIDGSDVAVIAFLVKPAAPPADGPDSLGEFGVVDPDTGRAQFRIARVEKGAELVAGMETFETVYFGDADFEKPFLIRAIAGENDSLEWNIPLPLSELGMQYIDHLKSLPPSGAERLSYFMKYLQHEDPLLSQDAYDEFAKAPYADVIALKDQIDKEQLWKWIESRDVSPSRRSLFFTMLGVAGDRTDADRLEEMMLSDSRVLRSASEAAAAASMAIGGPITIPVVPELVAMEERRKQLGFNALVGCYLKLRGAEGLDVVDRHFLANPDADYTQVYATCLALRFLGEETDIVPMERLRQSMRLVLDKPEFVEQAITDLARWEDWTVLDRLVEMYENAPERTYIKEPIIAYLDRASQQSGDTGSQAKAALAVLEEKDPETVKRARSLLAFGFLGRARGASTTEQSATADTASSGEESNPVAATPKTFSTESALPTAEDAPGVQTDTDAQVATDTDPVDIPQPTAPQEEPKAEEGIADTPPATTEPETSAEEPAETGATSPVATASPADEVAEEPAISSVVMYTLPLVALVGFMALVWVILRGGV